MVTDDGKVTKDVSDVVLLPLPVEPTVREGGGEEGQNPVDDICLPILHGHGLSLSVLCGQELHLLIFHGQELHDGDGLLDDLGKLRLGDGLIVLLLGESLAVLHRGDGLVVLRLGEGLDTGHLGRHITAAPDIGKLLTASTDIEELVTAASGSAS